MDKRREVIINTLASKYYYFLNTLPFDDTLFMKGIHEGKGKFLANLHIYLATKDLPKKWNDKRYSTDFATPTALEVLKTNTVTGLEYEHLIPKKKYIQDICEQKAKDGTLTEEFIRSLLDRYLWTATVTSQEHKSLSRRVMPLNWDQKNINARYEVADIVLVPHKKDYIS
ncbi:hypothetical protein [Bacillus sp. UMB0728]|uniref:hypothetical protein n=1 Tax=Bacillus sp. UMB0728 TaxID=2066052 RepID=UPI000C7626AE|nr:hypothetical protein [Bacillus sp. UMB0728]PLR70284.1 hypothetical protein CYJ37_25015 [Bacillus sp. UMB0728]